MRTYTATMVSISTAALIVSCTGGRGADGNDGSSCSTSRSGSQVTIQCDDGTSVTVTDGATGPAGKNGADGEDGATGNDGKNGQNALIALLDEPPGANCPTGGTRVTVGLDSNANKTLEDVEVTSTRYICSSPSGATGPTGPAGAMGSTGPLGAEGPSGATGPTGPVGATGVNGKNTLVATSTEPAGSHCANGGLRVDVGIDSDGSGALESLEITQTSYLCQNNCQIENSKLTISAVATGSLNYSDDSYLDANVLLASTSSTSDSVGWMRFSLAGLTADRVVVDLRLYVRQNPDAGSQTGSPVLRVVHGPAVNFARNTLTAASMTRGKFISMQVSSFALNGWNEIPLHIDSTTLAADRTSEVLTLGLDEVTTPTQSIGFFGSDDPTTRPYLEIETIRCALPE